MQDQFLQSQGIYLCNVLRQALYLIGVYCDGKLERGKPVHVVGEASAL